MHWFYADTHFNHKNLVKGESAWEDKSGCRPFNSREDHDNFLLHDVINASVKKDDILWHLGDFSFGGEEWIAMFRNRIICETVHIVLGNHDHHIRKHAGSAFMRYGFASVQDYLELEVDGTQVVLCHYPLESWVNMEKGAKHLHGHVHGNIRQMDGRAEPSYESWGLMSIEAVRALMKPASTQRHKSIEGGNRFGVGG